MKNIKIFLSLLIVHCTLLIGTASAQWWVSGGNLLWPYGTVSATDSFSVGGNASIAGDLSVTGDFSVTGEINGVKKYLAYISHDGSSFTVNVIDTSLGTINWTRNSIGDYTGTFSDFTVDVDKTMLIASPLSSADGATINPIRLELILALFVFVKLSLISILGYMVLFTMLVFVCITFI